MLASSARMGDELQRVQRGYAPVAFQLHVGLKDLQIKRALGCGTFGKARGASQLFCLCSEGCDASNTFPELAARRGGRCSCFAAARHSCPGSHMMVLM
jgi:hypothetical protein